MKSTNRTAAVSGTKLFVLAAMIGTAAMLSGCNTTAGAGQDIRATGQTITNGAVAVKDKL